MQTEDKGKQPEHQSGKQHQEPGDRKDPPGPDDRIKEKPAMTEQKDAAFKLPKPRVYTGKGPDKDPEKFRQWRSELTDYFH